MIQHIADLLIHGSSDLGEIGALSDWNGLHTFTEFAVYKGATCKLLLLSISQYINGARRASGSCDRALSAIY